MRNHPTTAEHRLWQALRNQQLGVKFRRQVLVGPYILDFACLPAKVAVEVDGGQHATRAADPGRDAWLTGQGFRVLRFWNTQVMGELPGVLEVIRGAVARG